MTAAARTHDATALLAFLRDKRWFGDRTRELRGASVRDEVPVTWPGSTKRFAVLRVDVATERGTSTYQLFTGPEAGGITDALEDADFRRGLVDGFAEDLSFEHAGTRWQLRAEGTRPLIVPPATAIRLSEAEQSNSSLIVDGAAILKIFRRLEPGAHPDVEITRFLTIDRRFVHVPVLLGTIRFRDAGGETVAGMLQELVPGAVDGWTYALTVSREWLAGARAAGEPPFARDARQLGQVTRALHETLASGAAGSAFEALPATDADLDGWLARTTSMIDRADTSLRQALSAGRIPDAHAGLAESVARSIGTIREQVPAVAGAIGADRGRLARTHGDYHLGQVIRSAAGQFFVIDFEGEPARPLHERRARQSPLRDVAGMLRSFAYAAAVGSAAAERPAADRAMAWETQARDAFLRAYFQAAGAGHGLLPADAGHARGLLSLFETEKIFYELQYELDHRPDWVWVPLSGIAKLAT